MLAEANEAAQTRAPDQVPQGATLIRIARLHDRALIAETLAHPRIYPHISDDFTPPPSDIDAVLCDDVLYLGAFRRDAYLGLFMVHAHSGVLFEVHTCLLPAAWGADAVQCARSCIAWVFGNTACRRLVTSVPSDNLLAHRLAVRSGMRQYGFNSRSIARGGVLLDQVLLGINKD